MVGRGLLHRAVEVDDTRGRILDDPGRETDPHRTAVTTPKGGLEVADRRGSVESEPPSLTLATVHEEARHLSPGELLGGREPEDRRQGGVRLQDLTVHRGDEDADRQALDQPPVGRVADRVEAATTGAEEGGTDRRREAEEPPAFLLDEAVGAVAKRLGDDLLPDGPGEDDQSGLRPGLAHQAQDVRGRHEPELGIDDREPEAPPAESAREGRGIAGLVEVELTELVLEDDTGEPTIVGISVHEQDRRQDLHASPDRVFR